MALKHNKKRNSGMLRDFFATYIAESVVSKNNAKVSAAKKVWKRHVRLGSELRKEMRLFEALHGKRIKSKQVAYDLLSKVKKAANNLNREELDREKTALIRDINQTLGESFFRQQVKDYTEQASIQILMNYCSSNTLKEGVINPAMTEIEDRILSYMTSVADAPKDGRQLNEVLKQSEKEADGLVVNIMREKMNKKFSPRLTDDQKTILQQYVFDADTKKLKETLTVLRDDTLRLITEELNGKIDKTNREKLENIRGLLENDYKDISNLSETTVTFYMTVSKLNDELKDD